MATQLRSPPPAHLGPRPFKVVHTHSVITDDVKQKYPCKEKQNHRGSIGGIKRFMAFAFNRPECGSWISTQRVSLNFSKTL